MIVKIYYLKEQMKNLLMRLLELVKINY